MADTILLIHGYGCAGDVWDPMAARLRAEGYRVAAPTIRSDVRTVDGPRAGLIGLTLADYVAEMSALAESLAKEDGKKPIIFGHSMGGLIAQKIAEAGHAERLVLFAPASPADARGKPKLTPVFTFLNMALRPKPETKAGKMWKPGFKFGVVNVVPAPRHDALYATMVHDSGQVLADLAWPHKDPHKAAHVDAAKVTVPVLVLAGALDRTTPLDDVRLIGRKYAAAELKVYPDNAHYLIDEPNTMSILDDVIAWLTGKKKAAATPAPAPVKTAEPEPVKAAEPAPTPAPAPVEAAPAPPPTPAPAPAPAPAKAPAAKKAPAAAKPPAKPKTAPKPAAKPKAPVKLATKAEAPKAAPAAKTAKAVTPKAAPAPKTAAKAAPKAPTKAKTEPALGFGPSTKGVSTTKAKAEAKAETAAPVKTAKAPAKTAAPKTAAPKAAPAPKTAKVDAKPAAKAPAAPAKAPAKAKAAPAPKATPAPKAAKPAPAPKAAAKPAAKVAAKPAAATKAPATKTTAKSSPSKTKSV